MESFGEKLIKYRTEKGLSKNELAKRVGVTHTTIANLEKGNIKNVTVSLAIKLSEALNVAFTDFFQIETHGSLVATQVMISDYEEQIKYYKERLKEKDKYINALENDIMKRAIIFAQDFLLDIDEKIRIAIKAGGDLDQLYAGLDSTAASAIAIKLYGLGDLHHAAGKTPGLHHAKKWLQRFTQENKDEYWINKNTSIPHSTL